MLRKTSGWRRRSSCCPRSGRSSCPRPNFFLDLWHSIGCLSVPALILQGLEAISAGKSQFLQEEHGCQERVTAALWQVSELARELEVAHRESQDRAELVDRVQERATVAEQEFAATQAHLVEAVVVVEEHLEVEHCALERATAVEQVLASAQVRLVEVEAASQEALGVERTA